MKVQLLWFNGCPNHEDARALLRLVMAERRITLDIDDVDATDPRVAERYRSPGSPTVRVNDRDVEPGFVDPGDYTPRCRLYPTSAGLRGLPERRWIEDALDEAQHAHGEERRA